MLSTYRTVLACLLSSTALAATSADDLSKFSQTIFLPWTSPFSRASTYTPSVRGSVLGKSFDFPIDTGSTGVLISASLLPSVKLGDQNPTGWEFLDSSDILYNGRFVDLDISFFGTNGDQATSRVPVLVVTKIVKCPGYDVTNGNGVCPPEKLDQKWSQTARTVLYMGVGFGRNVPGSGIPYGTPDHNPFINVVRLSKYKELSIQQGYTVSTNGVYLGLTEGNTKGAVWQQLQNMAGSDPRAWAPPLVAFKYDDSNNPVQAQALIDTGVTQMYIQSTPEYPLPNVALPNPNPPPGELQRVKPGTKLSFAFPDFKVGEAGYDFVVGDTEFPSQPSYVQPVSSGSGPFVNTGRNFLYGFSVAFDAIAGRYGLICEKCGGDKGKGDAGLKPPQEPKPIEQPKPTQKPQPPRPKPPQKPKPIQKPKPMKPTRPPAKKPPKGAGNWWDEYENLYIGKDGKPITKDKPTVVDQTKGDNLGTWWNAYKGYYDQKEEASNEGVD